MCYGAKNTHVFDGSGHDWIRHRSWSRLFRCTKCELTAHAHAHEWDNRPYSCNLIRPEGWDGPLDCVTMSNRLLVMGIMLT